MFNQPRFFALLMMALSVVTFIACTKPAPQEPLTEDETFRNLDPDQKALPKDEPLDVATKPVTDTTLDGDGTLIAPGAESTAVEPKPKFDGKNDARGSFPEPESRRPVGSGGQKRFIKASEMNIRAQPNRHSKVVGRLVGGDEVRVTIHGGWAKLEDGQWIRSRWLVKKRPKQFDRVADEMGDHREPSTPRKKSPATKRAGSNKSRN
jgi:hypothetical protein